ncbi:MAG TPA: hypothetical protein VLC28_14090 [Flavitalea sp.]|nr:hypothetical protein [Flavitalea sp.]
MKNTLLIIAIGILPVFESFKIPTMKTVEGAFIYQHQNGEDWLMLKDNYLIHTSFNKNAKQFHFSRGGVYTVDGQNLKWKVEFDTRDSKKVGQTESIHFELKNESLNFDKKEYKRSDDGWSPLAGYFRISGRRQGEQMNDMPLAPRKTIKLLTANKFQWAAINTSTGEFFGTGGGSYTFENGKYTENIEFFSRDSSRVGASLQFSDTLQGRRWIHSGLSSKGDPIYEIWTREPITY